MLPRSRPMAASFPVRAQCARTGARAAAELAEPHVGFATCRVTRIPPHFRMRFRLWFAVGVLLGLGGGLAFGLRWLGQSGTATAGDAVSLRGEVSFRTPARWHRTACPGPPIDCTMARPASGAPAASPA